MFTAEAVILNVEELYHYQIKKEITCHYTWIVITLKARRKAQ